MKRVLCTALLALVAACAIAQTATTSVALGWTAPTQNVDGSAISGALTYNLYQGPKAGPFTKVGSGLAAVSTTVTSLAAGACFAVTAVETTGSESALSNTACALQSAAPSGMSVVVTVTVK
jgi:hypothetical protein